MEAHRSGPGAVMQALSDLSEARVWTMEMSLCLTSILSAAELVENLTAEGDHKLCRAALGQMATLIHLLRQLVESTRRELADDGTEIENDA